MKYHYDSAFTIAKKCSKCTRSRTPMNHIYITKSKFIYCAICLDKLEKEDPKFGLGTEATEDKRRLFYPKDYWK